MRTRLTVRPPGPVCAVTRFTAEHVRSDVRGLVGRVGELDAAGFAAAAGMNLRFYNDYAGSESVPRLRGLPPSRKPLRRVEW